MIFICFNFIFFYTGPKSTQSYKAPELVFTDTLISTWINSGKPHQLPVQKAHHVTSAFLCRDAPNKLDIYYVCCGKRGSNLCTHGALAPRFVSLHTSYHALTHQIKNSSAGFIFVLTQTQFYTFLQ